MATYFIKNKMQYYYHSHIQQAEPIVLDEELSRHLVQVLRLGIGGQIILTNGAGTIAQATIIDNHKKHTTVKVQQLKVQPAASTQQHLALAFTKNNARIEWLLEKVTELGITHIWPISTSRSEAQYLKYARLHKIIQSAMCQSQQAYMPQLHTECSLEALFTQITTSTKKHIAHCLPSDNKAPIATLSNTNDNLILIGPEGDFTQNEIDLCVQQHACTPLTIGYTRLRTETAALMAASFMMLNTIK
jgi:16S rRNA (uracil1498-N3)-methyltransferase